MLLTEKSVMQTSVRVNVKVPSDGASVASLLIDSLSCSSHFCSMLKSLVPLESLETYWRRSARKIKTTEHKKKNTGFENAFHGRSARRMLNSLVSM